MRFRQVREGEWKQAVMRGFLLQCCKCHAIHRINFRVVHRGKKHNVQWQAFAITHRQAAAHLKKRIRAKRKNRAA